MKYLDDARDVSFNIFEWLDLDALLRSPRYQGFDRDQLRMVLDEILKLSRGSLAACNEVGDRGGARFENGVVTVPAQFRSAYRELCDGGWISPTMNAEYGGMGLPDTIGSGINEYIVGANCSLSLGLLLTRGAAHLIETFGSEALKARYCSRMYAGEWAGTMCLTEAGAGSDLGAVRTTATPQADGTWLLSGEKIFITCGDHDFTSTIVHAVLARTPDSPPGVKGLSLFLVPKHRIGADGSVGERNDVACAGIEHKMGIHGSPTCTLVFGANGGCRGDLLGKERAGLAQMFQMMNAARYEVGLQGVAIGSAAHQAALAFARERLQGRSNRDPGNPAQVAIIEHPDVRRSLLLQSAYVQGMRALVSYTGWSMDMAHVTTGEEHAAHEGLVDLLTPICKAWCSDWGFRVCEWAMQVFGGYGYSVEYPAEQYLRDVKIASIYEGTNGIQALDLVGRKFRLQDGRPVKALLGRVTQTVQTLANHPVLGGSAQQLGSALKSLGAVLTEIPARSDAALLTMLNAVPVLDMMGHVVAADLLLRQATVASQTLGTALAAQGVDATDRAAVRAAAGKNPELAFYHRKIQAAICFAHRALPQTVALAVGVRTGDTSPMDAVF